VRDHGFRHCLEGLGLNMDWPNSEKLSAQMYLPDILGWDLYLIGALESPYAEVV